MNDVKPGQGKWRLKGRGGTLMCHRNRPWFKTFHGFQRQCQVCGYQWNMADNRSGVEIGVIEKVRFIEV